MVDQNIEGVVTLGMRGNGDTALPDGDGIDLMKSIIAAERQILANVTGKDVTTIPQVWTMYKEVLRYWDEGLRPPDDVIVVFTDDNWGNIRRVPDPSQPPHPGGYGLYYHFDYVGGGRDYKWVDTASIANTWQQLNMAFSFGDAEAVGGQRRRHEGQRAAAAVLPGLRVEPRPLDRRQPRRVGAGLRRAELRAAGRRAHGGDAARLWQAPGAAQARAAEPADHP